MMGGTVTINCSPKMLTGPVTTNQRFCKIEDCKVSANIFQVSNRQSAQPGVEHFGCDCPSNLDKGVKFI